MATNKEYAEEVAAEIVKRLKEGTAPWQKPWEPGELAAPYNAQTGKPYRGFNSVWLGMFSQYDDPRWLTYKQAEAMGAQVRKGEKGVQLVYFSTSGRVPEKDDKGQPVKGEDGKQKYVDVALMSPIMKRFTVFNAAQIDGLPELVRPERSEPGPRHAQAERIMAGSGVPIQHIAGDRAYYSPREDKIVLPTIEQFKDMDCYYATAMHELGHATGHKSRLDRDLTNPFGSQGYAKEELRAEIASLMIGQQIGLGHDPEQHAAYVGSWIKALQEDPQEIFRASADAQKITEMVMGWDLEQQQGHENELDADPVQIGERVTFTAHDKDDPLSVGTVEGLIIDAQPTNDGNIRYRIQTDTVAPQGGGLLETLVYSHQGTIQRMDEHDQQQSRAQQQQAARPVLIENGDKAMEKTWLNVPFAEKNDAKALGARWDREARSWYAPEGADLAGLKKWIDKPAVQQESPAVELAAALRAAGLQIEGMPVMDGTRQRVPVEGDTGKEVSGSYIAFSDGHPAASIQNYKTGFKENWRWSGTSQTISAAQRTELEKEHQERLAQKEQEREARYAERAAELSEALATGTNYAAANPNHAYLAAKDLAGNELDPRIKQDQRGNLIIPATDIDGNIQTVQWIGQGGTKGFAAGAKMQGAMHIHGQNEAGPIIIGEGWATMETIHRATGAMAVTAFTEGNLGHVATAIREKWPDRPIVIAGDNDHQREAEGKTNVGKQAAERAAKAVNGYAAIPAFGVESKGSDWNDYAKEKGTTELQKALNESMVLADRRRLADAQMLGNDGERVEEIVRQNQAKMENQKGANVADMKSAYADLRLKAGKEADRQDKSDEAPKQDQEQGEEQQKTQTRSRGTGRSRSR